MNTLPSAIWGSARQGWRGKLPPRYSDRWDERFRHLALPMLDEGTQVLDVGSGRRPILEPQLRLNTCRYVGLDISRSELDCAPAGAYDDVVVADVETFQPQLVGRFGLILSWWVLEHVRRLDQALENLRRYTHPDGGRLVAFLSGRRSLAGMANRLFPYRLTCWLLARLNERDPDSIFPAYYDRCTYGELTQMSSSWRSFKVIPVFQNGLYLRSVRPLLGLYLGYEEWAYQAGRDNLATHYLLVADS